MTQIEKQLIDRGAKSHIQILDFLRGIAALSVVFFHFSGSALPTIKPNALTEFFSFGKLGVQVFFVISGFIIPYSMHVAGYSIKSAGTFIAKRLARIGPPSWIAILLLFIVYYGALEMNGKPIQGMPWPGLAFKTIFANMFYCYSILKTGLYNEVYWTLEIEFQYYIFIAFMLPVIQRAAKNEILLSILLAIISITWFFHYDTIYFFRDNTFFLMGILLFLRKTNQISRNYMSYASMGLMLICYAQQGLPNSFAAIITFLIIAHVQFASPFTDFLGKISYSLYITHHFAGITSEYVLRNLTGLEVSEPLKVVMVFVYTGCAILFAWIFYMLVEKPFIHLSKKIKTR